jgi:cation transport ATPase
MAVTTELAQTTQVELAVGGMTCAACAARVQAKLQKVTGVTASVNLSTERAYVSAPPTVSAADLIGVVEKAGYTAGLAPPPEPQAAETTETTGTAEDAAVRRLRRRLMVALVFFVPLTDASMMLGIFPWTRFPGWQWVLIALAAPVATWAAWPFHAAALRQARHLSSSMDTLVSLGILAAVGWSVYAMFALDRGRKDPSGLGSLLHGGAGGGIYLEVAASVTTFLLAGSPAGRAAKPSAAAAVARLRALGLRPALLTGDNAATARAVGAAAGIGEIRSEALPAGKAQVIRDLQSQGRSVAMVGDGVNDGPALAAARLGLALGSGTDVAIAAADMIVLRDDLGAVPDAIALARAASRTIRANLAWAFCYNVLAIPLAALGLASPLLAAATMTLSSVFVVWNSLRLRRFRPG